MKKGFSSNMEDDAARKDQFDDIIVIFAFIQDKDVFFKGWRRIFPMRP